MKLIDFDGLFDEKVAQYMKQSGKKRTEKQWEDLIPKLYKQFGDTYIAKIKCTPKQYYAKMTDGELVETLSAHLEENVPVPEFLAEELEKRDLTPMLLPLLTHENKEIAAYAVNLVGGDARAFEGYFSILTGENADEDLKNEVVGILREHANEVKELALQTYQKGVGAAYALEILSRITEKDDRVYQTLLDAFLKAEEWERSLRADELAAYGDERALPHLYRAIEDASLGFVEFRELKYAIEALGGEYNEERTFTDKDYLLVQSAENKADENK